VDSTVPYRLQVRGQQRLTASVSSPAFSAPPKIDLYEAARPTGVPTRRPSISGPPASKSGPAAPHAVENTGGGGDDTGGGSAPPLDANTLVLRFAPSEPGVYTVRAVLAFT